MKCMRQRYRLVHSTFVTAGLNPFIVSRDDKLCAPQSALRQLAQEGRPVGLRLPGANLHTYNLAPAVAVDTGGNDDGGERLLGHAPGGKKPGKQEPFRSFRMPSSTVAARVSQSLSR